MNILTNTLTNNDWPIQWFFRFVYDTIEFVNDYLILLEGLAS